MDKRYQVFFSSTYMDLQEERQEVLQALLELDCIPSGMELFPAADETQWSLIQRVIGECDYYVLILAGRYGSLGPNGVGYTEMEYQHALKLGKPTIAFLHANIGSLPANRSEESAEGRKKLSAFREFAQKKLCKHWIGPKDLGAVVSRSITQLIKNRPAVGWVRADAMPSEDTTSEILRLRDRIDELEAELQQVRTSPPKGTENLAQGKRKVTIRYIDTSWRATLGTAEDGSKGRFECTWDDIFSAVAPVIIQPTPETELRLALTRFVILHTKGSEFVEPGTFHIERDDFQTVKLQLRALGLIALAKKPTTSEDSDTYWVLTPYGDELMMRLRAIPGDAG